MTIYVDPLIQYTYRPTARFSGRWCHLTADTPDELHAFAQRIGLQRVWFQEHATLWHYDLTPSKRAVAVRAGASELGRMEMGRLMRRRAQDTAPSQGENK